MPEDYDAEIVEFWPELAQSVDLFITISTQWRVGMNGPTGLDYNVLFHELDRMALTKIDYDFLFEDIRVMESAALAVIQKKD